MKKCNIEGVKHYLGQAIAEAGMTQKEALAAAQKNGRAKITNETIASALAENGWETNGQIQGTMIKVDEVMYSAEQLAARDLLAWMVK